VRVIRSPPCRKSPLWLDDGEKPVWRTNYNTVRLEQIDNYLKLDNLYHHLKKEFLSRMLRWLQSRKGNRHRWYVVSLRAWRHHVIAGYWSFPESSKGKCSNDVAETHRLPKGRNDWVRPVIVRFDNRRSSDLIYSARRELRNSHSVPTPIYINEHLTKRSDYLFLECRKMWKSRKISSAWTWNGNVFIKTPGNRRWSHRQGALSGGSQQCVILTNYYWACWCEPTFNWDFSITCLMIIHFIMTYHL